MSSATLHPKRSAHEALQPAAVAARLLENLDEQALTWCVLGDARQVSTEIRGDLDLMIEPAALARFTRLLYRLCYDLGLELVQCWQHQASCHSFVVSWRDGSGPRLSFTADVCGDFLRNGRLFLSASELLPERRAAHDSPGVIVPAPRHAFIYYLLKKVDKRRLDERQAEYLQGVWDEDPAGASVQIERFWPSSHAARLIEAVRVGNWWQIRRDLPELRSALYRTLPHSPARTWRELRRKVRRVLHPTGLQVVLLGMDGTGKSSVAEALMHTGVPGFRQFRYTHFRPGFRGHDGGGPSPEPMPRPQGMAPRGVIGSTAKLLYYVGDYLVGYVTGTRPAMVHSALVLFDRYYHDLLVDPLRYRYGGSLALVRWLARLVPRPDVVILLDARSEVVEARKQEVAHAEVQRQRQAYLDLVRHLPYGYVVNADQPLDRVVADVERLIVKRAAARTRAELAHDAVAAPRRRRR